MYIGISSRNALKFALILLLVLGFVYGPGRSCCDKWLYSLGLRMPDKHIVVVGSGLAGLTAVSSALDQGFSVSLIDKNKSVGGNSSKATSGINAAGSRFQGNTDDSPHLFRDDILKSGKGQCVKPLVDILTWGSAPAVEYVVDVWDVPLTSVEYMGGASKPRCHRIPPVNGKVAPVGWTVVKAAHGYIKQNEKYTELLETEVLGLSFHSEDPQVVIGVNILNNNTGEKSIVEADAVILASGGYSNSKAILSTLNPPLDEYPTTNGWFSTGDLISWALKEEVDTIHLDYVQLHPTSFVDPRDPLNGTKFLAPEILRGVGGLLLDLKGKTIGDSLSTRDVLTESIKKDGFTLDAALETFRSLDIFGSYINEEAHPTGTPSIALLVLSEESAERAGGMIGFYKMKGFMREILISDLLDIMQTDKLEGFEGDGKVLISFVTPATHFSMGGLEIDHLGRVKRKGEAIINVFAAGEVSGGVHGYNRLGGNGCLESLVFGRWTAQNAYRLLYPAKSSLIVSVAFPEDSKDAAEVLVHVPSLLTKGLIVGEEYDLCVPSTKGSYKVQLDGISPLGVEGGTFTGTLCKFQMMEGDVQVVHPWTEVDITQIGECTKRDEL